MQYPQDPTVAIFGFAGDLGTIGFRCGTLFKYILNPPFSPKWPPSLDSVNIGK